VPEPHQITGRRQPREPGTHDDDVGIGWDMSLRLGSHAVKVMTALFGPTDAVRARARPAGSRRQRRLHLRGAARRASPRWHWPPRSRTWT
jgi:hypothetical protein